jgi:hypothetical protein
LDEPVDDLADAPMPVGFRSLAGTLRRWRAQIPAWYAACLSNGPAEALNNPFKFVKRVAFGMRHFQHQSGSPDPGVDVVVAGGVVDLPALRPQHVGASRHPALTVELAAPGPGGVAGAEQTIEAARIELGGDDTAAGASDGAESMRSRGARTTAT